MRAHHASDNLSHAAVKHFAADELYDIALDEYRRAGRHINQAEKEGITQWAYWSAERDDFRTEDEARAELRAHLSEECE